MLVAESGIHRIKTFARKEDAWLADAYLRRHAFTHHCTVGDGFAYFRRSVDVDTWGN
jgi:hypothetical protein